MFRVASRAVRVNARPWPAAARRPLSTSVPRPSRALLLASAAGLSLAGALALHRAPLFADAYPAPGQGGPHQLFSIADTSEADTDTVVDADTGVTFPRVLHVQSKAALPPLTLLGVGVRTVSFLAIKVYSVGFYADLTNPDLQIPADATPEEKIEHIVRSGACLLRIVPTRSTSHTHLRDGFVRAVQGRLNAARGTLAPDAALAAHAALRQLQTLFPNTPLAKGTPLDVVLTPPERGSAQRALVFRDLGAVPDAWLPREFVLAYFAGDGISPPLKKQVVAAVENLGR